MSNEEYFEKIDLAEIESLVDNKQEENLYLEFKTVNHPVYNDGNKNVDKKHFSTCLSGFANSNGGIVIWGIKANKELNGVDCANDLKPIKQLTKLINMFNSLEGQAVTPTIRGVKHKKIDNGEDTGFIVTYVPESDSSPHMANFADNHYYKRNGDSFLRAEHFDIIDMLSRRRQPRLKLECKNIKKVLERGTHWRFEFIVSLTNEGKVTAKYPYLAFNISRPFHRETYGVNGMGFTGLKLTSDNLNYLHCYRGGNEIVIHPQMTLDVDKIQGDIEKSYAPKDVTIEYLLMAENMEPIKGKILVTKEELMK